MTEALANYKTKGKKAAGMKTGGAKRVRKKAAGLRTGSGLGPKKGKKAAGMRAGATKTRRKKKAAGLGSDIGNMVINAAGTAIGVVIGGVYKAGKAAVKQLTKKGGAKRLSSGVGKKGLGGGPKSTGYVRKKKAGMRLGGATRRPKTHFLGGAKPKRARRPNPWLAHVKKTMKANKGMAFKAVLKKAKASYKKK